MRTYCAANPVEYEHKQKIRWSAIEEGSFQIFGIVVQEIAHQQPMEASLRRDWIVEQGGQWTPNLKES
jgi:hypothetical protein